MKTKGATAEVFLTAFRTLKKEEQDIFLTSLMKDEALREDMIDIAIAAKRSKEKGRPFKEFLAETEKKVSHR